MKYTSHRKTYISDHLYADSKARSLKKYKVLCAHQGFEEKGGRDENVNVGQSVKN